MATATIARRTLVDDHIPTGPNAVRFSTATGTLTLDATYRQYLQDFRGYTVQLRAWAKTSGASTIRAQLMVDGAVVVSTDYHGGGGQWDLISLATPYAIAVGTSEIGIRLDYGSAANTADVGAVWLEGGPTIREYPFPSGLAPDGPLEVHMAPISIDPTNAVTDTRPTSFRSLRGWEMYTYNAEAGATEVGVLVLRDGGVSDGWRLWMPVDGPLTLPTADTGSVELSLRDSFLIAKLAAAKLVERDLASITGPQREEYQAWADRQRAAVDKMGQGKGSRDVGWAPLGFRW